MEITDEAPRRHSDLDVAFDAMRQIANPAMSPSQDTNETIAEGDRSDVLRPILDAADAAGLPDQGLDETIAEGGRTNLLSRIAKNRLYTRDETAPDAPEARVPSRVCT